jgi:hypothetical protein
MVHHAHESESDLMQSLFMGNMRSNVYGLYKRIVKQKHLKDFYQIKNETKPVLTEKIVIIVFLIISKSPDNHLH